ncbi:type VI secretion system membrane subunit TssM [Massilia sp. NR 4-1]|uniref:type VI secretion system membrane subunit TssM n=1 Tax=Massilia sp. NR 4-1 TaxID=1678028 RepID=UPI000AB9A992|nr:type VI secretion system membrane subunit TssM [Massilia sp. NR 4-1]
MMRRIWTFLSDSRHLTIIGFIAMAAFFYLGAELLELALIWAIAATLAGVLLYWLARWLRRWLAMRKVAQLEQAIEQDAAAPDAAAQDNSGTDALRKGLLHAIHTIKTSRIGVATGAKALYELPWYLVIGNPGAGKSSAIARSGLQFPMAEGGAAVAVGGTRNCDWFFSTDGILLDTAGRYAAGEEDRQEWLGFLDLLKKYRKRAPVNGVLLAVSIAELRGEDPEAVQRLARNLRRRVQDLIERLEVFAPIYVVFTKADLIAGFTQFFAQSEAGDRERIWGATMPYKRKSASQDILPFFDQAFDELHEGLKELSVSSMAQQRPGCRAPGVFGFPHEFAALRAPLRAFLGALFEDNRFQFKPVFRGFYFTSALQEGMPGSFLAQQIAGRFRLSLPVAQQAAESRSCGYFMLDLFRKVVFADRYLVTQYASRNKIRLRYGVFLVSALALGAALAGWSWAYMANRQLATNVKADLEKVVQLQARSPELQARMEALEILQDRIEQLTRYRRERPWPLRFGLYQGDTLEHKLRGEYYAGMREILLKPVAGSLEAQLNEYNARAAADGGTAKAEDVYNALKAYLMLSEREHAEPGHLNDQASRHWRGWLEANRGAMTSEKLVRMAEHLMSFYLAQTADPAWPQIEQKLVLVDATRENLRRVASGMPARERIYAEIRARAATRFPSMAVVRMVGDQDRALVAGSYAVSGAFTREAWEKYVLGAIRDASNGAQSSTDWVLKTARKDDLTLDGSPEQIQKALTELYKNDYVKEWQKFLQGVAIADMKDLNTAATAMSRLGDAQSSPLLKVLSAIREQTAWDNPSAVNAGMQQAQTGFVNWLRNSLMQRAPSPVNANVNLNIQLDASKYEKPLGQIGREFAGLERLLASRERDAAPIRSYLDSLARLRARLLALKNQGDPGPGARQLMLQTLEGSGSELSDALRLVDDQLLAGMSESQKQALRPLLVRPLMQTFAAIVEPVETELNKTWQAQICEPFNQSLAGKSPFTPSAGVEASQAEIARFFGPEGQISRFVSATMGALVIRRGDVLSPRTWADMGIRIQAPVLERLPFWIAPAGGNGLSGGAQTVFQILPFTAPGVQEYVIEIDGQQLRYRNTAPQWTNMVHPSPQGVPGARISATATDGRTVELFNEPGQFGLKRMIEAASRIRKEGGVHELRWTVSGVSIAVDLKITSSPAASAGATQQGTGFQGLRLPKTIAGGIQPALADAGSKP